MTAFGDWSPALQKGRVYERLLLDIVLGELKPGSRLDEAALAARYDAGLAGVREALARLALEELVVRRPRVGTQVAPLDLRELREAQAARLLIEPHGAALAARHATPAEVEGLRRVFDGHEAAVAAQDRRTLVAMDHRFHAGVMHAGHNDVLARIASGLQLRSARAWLAESVEAPDSAHLAAVAAHLRLVDRIAVRDEAGAADAMRAALVDPA